MTPQQQHILLAGLKRTTEAFFKRRVGIVTLDGSVRIDATGVLAVLAGWAGELIEGAPEDMRDALFMSFADTVVTVAGIKADESAEPQPQETLQ